MLNILIYDTQTGSKHYSLVRVMRDIVFKDTGINVHLLQKDNFQKFKNDKREHVIGFAFPGARAGTSYRRQLPENGNFDYYKQEIEKGKTSLNICAMAYNACNTFHYIHPTYRAESFIRSEVGLVDFNAYGPDLRLYTPREIDVNDPWTTFDAVKVNFQDKSGEKREAHLAFSQGPSFTPTATSKDYHVIARYDKTNEIAILDQKYGKGSIILSGPALEVGGENLLKHYLSPKASYNENAVEIIKKLTDSQESWSELWLDIAGRFVHQDPLYMAKIKKNLSLENRG